MTTYGPIYLLTEKKYSSRIIHNTTSKQYTTCPTPRVAGQSLRPRPTKNSTIEMPSSLFHLLEAHSLYLFPSLGELDWITCHKRKPWLWSSHFHNGTATWLKINIILTFLYERYLVMFLRNYTSRDLTHIIIEPASQTPIHHGHD